MLSAWGIDHGDEFGKARVSGPAWRMPKGLHSDKGLSVWGRGDKAGKEVNGYVHEVKNRVGQRRQLDPRMEGSMKAFKSSKGKKVVSRYVPKTITGPERGRFG